MILLIMCLLIMSLASGEFVANQNATTYKSRSPFSNFNVVKFRNNPCNGSDNKIGTCYTNSECKEKGGTSSGLCASNFGVCCILNMGCGGVSSENNTYFSGSKSGPGACEARFCSKADVCQIRVDFLSYTIDGPSTDMISTSDTLTVAAPGGTRIKNSFGSLTGMHIYSEPDPECNSLSLSFGAGTRKWEMKISTFSCDYEHLAPSGCTQYFYGNLEGAISAYNVQGSYGQLSKSSNKVCVRREKNVCQIHWIPATDNQEDFEISGTATTVGTTQLYGTTVKYGAYLKTTVGTTVEYDTYSRIGSSCNGAGLDSQITDEISYSFQLRLPTKEVFSSSNMESKLNYIQSAKC